MLLAFQKKTHISGIQKCSAAAYQMGKVPPVNLGNVHKCSNKTLPIPDGFTYNIAIALCLLRPVRLAGKKQNPKRKRTEKQPPAIGAGNREG